MYDWKEDRIPGFYDELLEGRFTLEKIRRFLRDEDGVAERELLGQLHLKKPNDPAVFKAIIAIAHRAAMLESNHLAPDGSSENNGSSQG